MKKPAHISILLIVSLIISSYAYAEYNVKSTSMSNKEIPSVYKETESPKPPAREVTLKWDPSPDPDLAGYRVYYDTKPGPPYDPGKADYADEGASPVIVKDKTSLTLHGLNPDKDYYFAITAFSSTSDMESEYSNQVSTLTMATSKTEPSPPDKTLSAVPIDRSPRNWTSFKDRVATSDKPSQEGEKSILKDQILLPGDSLHLEIPGQKEMSRIYDVDPEGNLYLDMVGKMFAKGLTLPALEEQVEEKLKKIIPRNEKVKANLVEQLRFIHIEGGVSYPGWYRVPLVTTLNELLQKAGGALTGAYISGIVLRRLVQGTLKEITELTGKLQVETSDILVVPFPKDYEPKIDNGDLLHVSIPTGVDESKAATTQMLTTTQTEVDRYGYINTPKFGSVFVRDLTPKQVSDMLTEKLPKFVSRSYKAKVILLQKKQYIQILGHVKNPGWYNIPETANVQTAINAAGDALDGAIMTDVTIQRQWEDKIYRIKVNLYQYNVSGDERILPPLHENDTVFIPYSASMGTIKRTLGVWVPPETKLEKDISSKVRILGAVRAPGVYEPTEDMDLLELLVMAKGEMEDADLANVQLIRGNEIKKINLQQILREDKFIVPKVENQDTIRVPFVEKAGYVSKGSENKVFVIGAVERPGPYEVTKDMDILEALVQASGERIDADLSNVTIIRGNKATKVNMKKLLDDQVLEMPKVQSGDVIRFDFMERLGMLSRGLKNKIHIIGAVSRPGRYEATTEGLNILDVLNQANGSLETADLSSIKIIQSEGIQTFDLKGFLQGSANRLEILPMVPGGTTVLVPYVQRVEFITENQIYVIGKVRNSGQYKLTEGMTVLQALALAGGLDEWAKQNKIVIVRTINGKQENISFNYDKGVSGKYPELNIRLKPKDVIVVP